MWWGGMRIGFASEYGERSKQQLEARTGDLQSPTHARAPRLPRTWRFAWLNVWLFDRLIERAAERAQRIVEQLPYRILCGPRVAAESHQEGPPEVEQAKEGARMLGMWLNLVTAPLDRDEATFFQEDCPARYKPFRLNNISAPPLVLSRSQNILIKRAQREAALDDEEYREALQAVCGCRSSTDGKMTDRHVDLVLAYFEAIYWRGVDAGRAAVARQPDCCFSAARILGLQKPPRQHFQRPIQRGQSSGRDFRSGARTGGHGIRGIILRGHSGESDGAAPARTFSTFTKRRCSGLSALSEKVAPQRSQVLA